VPDRGAAGSGQVLYVANSLDGTLTPLDGAGGHVIGPPLPAGPAPSQLAPGPPGTLLVASTAAGPGGPLTHVARAGPGWRARPLPLGEPAEVAHLAADGPRAVVAYHRPPDGAPGAPRCRLALLDARAGAVERTHTVCGAHELVTGLAFEDGPAGPVAYVGLQDTAASGALPGGGAGSRHRVVAVDAARGTPLAVRPTAGVPSHLVLAPGGARGGARLFAVETLAGPEDEPPRPPPGRLLGLDPTTLEVERQWPLDYRPTRLAVAPDGAWAYALLDATVRALDLTTGADRPLARLPERGLGLAVGRDRIYAVGPYGPGVWVLRRRDGRLVATAPVGRRPVALTLAGAA
jgi:DNA-binding beta-propeller fold protein YncE